jgi:HAD superfamily hydrolase (TIGR01549 family)
MNIKALVFDFDGVIARESEFLKQKAWEEVFRGYGVRAHALLKEALRHVRDIRGDRFDLLRYMYTHLDDTQPIEILVARGAELFEREFRKHMQEISIPHETYSGLSAVSRRFPLYINSATPTEVLLHTLAELRLTSFFKKVLGRPQSKLENFTYITTLEEILPPELLFIGDSEGDVEAAHTFGCRFLGIANEWNAWTIQEQPYAVLGSLADFFEEVDTHVVVM